MLKISLLVGAGAMLIAPTAAPITFDMKDPKGVSGMSISIDSMLEPVRGHANGVTGSIDFDSVNPAKSSGQIVVDTRTIFLASQPMTDAMHQDWCLDVKKYPTMTFTVKKISGVKKIKAGSWNVMVNGTLNMHGVTKPVSVAANVTYLPNMIKTRGGMEGVQGDLLKLQSKFSILRKDFKIAPDLNEQVIANRIDIDLALIGVAPK